MPTTNKQLNKAQYRKTDDEFYTRYTDIQQELKNYWPQLRGKIIYCNTDNPLFSNFYFYFKKHFQQIQPKKVIFTYYKPINLLNFTEASPNKTTLENEKEIKTTLTSDGDFRSNECSKIMQECDIVISNPPFSLFREYIGQLFRLNKKFLVVGNINAVTYRNVFRSIVNGNFSAGYNVINWFNGAGNKIRKVSNCAWYTNLKVDPKPFLKLKKAPPHIKYQSYENFLQAINIDKLQDIPQNYYRPMGVPITYFLKHNPNQFQITHLINNPTVQGQEIYRRMVIIKK